MKRIVTALVVAGLATAAFAGGPLHTYDPANRIPYAWSMPTWPDWHVPVYTDLGSLGVLDNARAYDEVDFAAYQWSSVPTSSFRATVVGDFSALGLGDIDGTSAASVIGEWNGGGIHVIYDTDGSIMADFFGLPTRVLGIANVEYIGVDSPEIAESWMVLSGPAIYANDPNGVGFQGVITHEMGHALNLGHSQANGAVWLPSVNDWPQPEGCSAPWTGGPGVPQDIETMYPISTPEPGDAGEYMGTVDRLDDMSALSNLYPAPGYPASRGTISGQVLDAWGAPVTGVNVIARNVDDPFNDFTSYITGQVSKGQAGPDGSFVLNGLTPGARYAIYTDNLLIGAFSVPRLVVLPGPEEYFNGAAESGDLALDDRCAWMTVPAQPGAPATVNITFGRYAGAPTLITAPTNSYPFDITPDGSIVVGGLSNQNGPIFRWDLDAGTFESIGGHRIGTPSISDDGTKIASTAIDTDGIVKPAIYQNGAWTPLPPVPGSIPCTQDGPTTTGSAWDISGDGSTVVGLSYGQSCFRGGIRAFKWTAAGGSVALPKFSSFNNMSRANGVNYDGSVIVGLDETTSGLWRGAYWEDGVVRLITRNGQSVQSALDVSRDGQYVVGQSSLPATSNSAWRHSVSGNSVELLGLMTGYNDSITSSISDDHGVIAGFTRSTTTGAFVPTIWTAGLHWSSFNTFLLAQGVYLSSYTAVLGASAMSADGRVLTGTFASLFGDVGFVVKTPTSIVCHAPAGSPTQVQTTIVSFPEGLDAALAGGDTLGPCQCNATAPTGIPALTIGQAAAGTAQLEWSGVAAATSYDLVRGSLSVLRSSHGDFAAATTDCLENDLPATSRDDSDTPGVGDGFFYLVRAVNCGGSATFDSGAPSQVGSRDAEIPASSSTCP